MTANQERNQRYPLLNFRAMEITPELRARARRDASNPELSQIAKRDLGRYYDLLRRSLPRVSVDEAAFLCDILNGTIQDEHLAAGLDAEVEDALQFNPSYSEKWGIDGQALLARIKSLPFSARLALVDAADRFWGPGYEVANIHDRLREIGFGRE